MWKLRPFPFSVVLVLASLMLSGRSLKAQETAPETGFIAAVIDGTSTDPAYDGPDTTDIALIDVSTRNVENLTQTPDWDEYDPTWSPDGTQLAYTGGQPSTATNDIYIMDVANRSVRNLSMGGGGIDPLAWSDLEWSPDGNTILFVIPIFRYAHPIGAFGLGETKGFSVVDWGTAPTWSPDGKRVAYQNINDEQLYIVDVGGGDPVKVMQDARVSEPDWSPDGKQIVFAENQPDYDKPNHLYLFDVDSSKITPLLTGQRLDYPDWSPDGKRIALSMVMNDTGVIVILDVQIGKLSEPLCSACGQPVWRPGSMSEKKP